MKKVKVKAYDREFQKYRRLHEAKANKEAWEWLKTTTPPHLQLDMNKYLMKLLIKAVKTNYTPQQIEDAKKWKQALMINTKKGVPYIKDGKVVTSYSIRSEVEEKFGKMLSDYLVYVLEIPRF